MRNGLGMHERPEAVPHSPIQSLPRCALVAFPMSGRLARGALLRAALARDLCPGFARFAQADGDRLLAALHLWVMTLAALERARFALRHRALHALARGLAVLARARP